MRYDGQNKQIVPGEFQNPPKQFTFTIADGAIQTVEYAHQFFRILTLSNAAGVTLRFGKTGLETDVVGAGLGYELDVATTATQIINRSGGAITITVIVSMARIYDDRLNVSGNINVVNAAGTELATDDSGATGVITQVNVGAAATQIIVANAARKSFLVENQSTVDFYMGVSNAVTTANGILVAAGASISMEYSGDLWGITASGTANTGVFSVAT